MDIKLIFFHVTIAYYLLIWNKQQKQSIKLKGQKIITFYFEFMWGGSSIYNLTSNLIAFLLLITVFTVITSWPLFQHVTVINRVLSRKFATRSLVNVCALTHSTATAVTSVHGDTMASPTVWPVDARYSYYKIGNHLLKHVFSLYKGLLRWFAKGIVVD